jgi:voltage-gated potassium channel
MGFARQAGAAAILVTLTLWFQCAGMSLLSHWARASIASGIRRLTPWHSILLMIRFTTAMIVLHILQILLWAGFITGAVFQLGSLASISRPAAIRPSAMGTLFSSAFCALWGPVESVIGILMSGMSVSALFAIVSRLVEAGAKSSTEARTYPLSLFRSNMVNFLCAALWARD